MACFGDEDLRAQRRSFNWGSGSNGWGALAPSSQQSSQHISIVLGMAVDNNKLRDQRRSFNDSGCDDTDDELLFEQVQNYVPPIKLACFASSRASLILEHKLCERDSTIGEIHHVLARNDGLASNILLEDRASPSPCHKTAPKRLRPHRAHRCIAESLATMPTIVEA